MIVLCPYSLTRRNLIKCVGEVIINHLIYGERNEMSPMTLVITSSYPAWTAAALITNLTNCWTAIPLYACIKVLWKIFEGLRTQQRLTFGQSEFFRVRMNAEESANVAHIRVWMKVSSSFPCWLLLVDGVYELKITWHNQFNAQLNRYFSQLTSSESGCWPCTSAISTNARKIEILITLFLLCSPAMNLSFFTVWRAER